MRTLFSVVNTKQCPRCGGDCLSRQKRKFWMRLMGGRYYRCARCGAGVILRQ